MREAVNMKTLKVKARIAHMLQPKKAPPVVAPKPIPPVVAPKPKKISPPVAPKPGQPEHTTYKHNLSNENKGKQEFEEWHIENYKDMFNSAR